MTKGIRGTESDNEWDAEPDPQCLMIPFVSLPFTLEHMTAIVRAIFREQHFCDERVSSAFQAFFANDMNIAYVSAVILKYVFCQGDHMNPLMQTLSPSAHELLFDFNQDQTSRSSTIVKKFTRAHHCGTRSSIHSLFPTSECSFIISDVSLSCWQTLMTEYQQRHCINRELMKAFHSLVRHPPEEVFTALSFQTHISTRMEPAIYVAEGDVLLIHHVVQHGMSEFFCLQEDEDLIDEASETSHKVILMFLLSPYCKATAVNVKRLMASIFGSKIDCQKIHHGAKCRNESRQLIEYQVDLSRMPSEFKCADFSPSDIFVHITQCAAELFQWAEKHGLPLVAVLSPYTRSIAYANGLLFFVSNKIFDVGVPNLDCELHYRLNIQK